MGRCGEEQLIGFKGLGRYGDCAGSGGYEGRQYEVGGQAAVGL